MSDDKLQLSRRKALAALGTVGVASAGAGLGTTAYFSDTENFANNQLTAGSLDLKVGWEEHYSDWSDDEGTGLSGSVEMESAGDGSTANLSDSTRVGLPADVAALISTEDAADAKQFLDNTQEDQYPQGYDSDDFPTGTSIDCSNTGSVALSDDDGSSPVISLNDVKPGDFGEVTFSFAICDNPGYVWAQAFLEDANENGTTEPEEEDPDEEEGVVELLDEIQVAFWLDDGNNFQNGGEQPLFTGSLRNVIEGNVPQIDGTGVRIDGQHVDVDNLVPTDFTAVGVNRFDFNDDGVFDADVALTADPVGGGKVAHATSDGVETADYVTTAVSLKSRPTLGNLTDDSSNPTTTLTYEYYGGPNNVKSAPDEVYLLIQESSGAQHVVYRASNDGEPAAEEWRTRNVHREVAGNPDYNDGYNWVEITESGTDNLGDGGPTSDLSDVYGDDAEVLAMAAGRGTTKGGDVLDVYYKNPEVGGNSAGTFPTSCFRGNGTVYNGVFAWWLPVDHANEIQTDSATFSLGLYTEQCRHNDGSGNPPTPDSN